MSRPPLEADARYAEYKARLEPLKGVVERAKVEAARDVERAKERVEADTLAIIRDAIEAGYSQYAVGKLVGKTRSEDQKKLIERAMGVNWVPRDDASDDRLVIDGYTIGDNTATAPDGTVYRFGRDASQRAVWHHPDGTVMTWDEADVLLTAAVEEYCQMNFD